MISPGVGDAAAPGGRDPTASSGAAADGSWAWRSRPDLGSAAASGHGGFAAHDGARSGDYCLHDVRGRYPDVLGRFTTGAVLSARSGAAQRSGRPIRAPTQRRGPHAGHAADAVAAASVRVRRPTGLDGRALARARGPLPRVRGAACARGPTGVVSRNLSSNDGTGTV